MFRLEVFGRKPTLEEILGEKFWLGPAPYGGMNHQEYLEMVTPKMAQPYQGFSGGHLLAQAAVTLVQQWALKAALKKFKEALTDREREAARKEVMEALAALRKSAARRGPDFKVILCRSRGRCSRVPLSSMKRSTSSIVRGTRAERLSSPLLRQKERILDADADVLVLLHRGATFSMNATFSGVFGRLSSAASRM